MKTTYPSWSVLGISAATLSVGALVLYGLFLLTGQAKAEIALVISAIIATETGVVLYHRSGSGKKSLGSKALLGGALAVSSLVISAVMQLLISWMTRPMVSIPVTAAGAFVLPFLLFNPMWNALDRNQGGTGSR